MGGVMLGSAAISICCSSGPQQQRLLTWPLAELPLSCDALVLTPTEHAELLASGSAMATALQRDSRWLWHRE